MTPDKVFVVGAYADENTPPASIKEDCCLVDCCECEKRLWIMTFNIAKIAICWKCVKKHSDIGINQEFMVSPEDIAVLKKLEEEKYERGKG